MSGDPAPPGATDGAPEGPGDMSTLELCLRHGDEEALRKLVDFGWSARATCQRTGRGALHIAAQWGGAEHLVDLLLGLGCESDFADGSGDFPLHLFARHGHEAGALALLASGVEPNRSDAAGRTPLDVADEVGNEGLEQLLRGFGGERRAGREGTPGADT